MPVVNVATRRKTEVDRLLKLAQKLVRMAGCNKGKVTITPDGNDWFLEAVNDGELASDLASLVNKSDYANVILAKDYDGIYDWSSDTYTRPCSCVWFTLP